MTQQVVLRSSPADKNQRRNTCSTGIADIINPVLIGKLGKCAGTDGVCSLPPIKQIYGMQDVEGRHAPARYVAKPHDRWLCVRLLQP